MALLGGFKQLVFRGDSKMGFELIRVRGSHHRMKHPDGRMTIIPVHGNKDFTERTNA